MKTLACVHCDHCLLLPYPPCLRLLLIVSLYLIALNSLLHLEMEEISLPCCLFPPMILVMYFCVKIINIF
ncbi:hypothetical protein B0H13DRAFT_2099840 [Mycena leptocephala]|nr:hypothetical protein B0H13DRAFT_2168155 [Mycena leptocephala]KAJ7841411.1 hypothetical protein B0H13DRAFT_2099840 [Mycena leptocephala]